MHIPDSIDIGANSKTPQQEMIKLLIFGIEKGKLEYGKFNHIMDPEGNKIELWEPIDSFFTKMGGATTK